MIQQISDLTDPNDPQGRTYKEVNAEKTHAIALGSLVELSSSERLYVTQHTRDCDKTPLYSLGLFSEIYIEEDHEDYERVRRHWKHGYDEESLMVVKGPEGDTAEANLAFSEFEGKVIEALEAFGEPHDEYAKSLIRSYYAKSLLPHQVALILQVSRREKLVLMVDAKSAVVERPESVESVFNFLQDHIIGKETIAYVESLELSLAENDEAFLAANELRAALQRALGVIDHIVKVTGFDERKVGEWRPQVEAALRLTFHK